VHRIREDKSAATFTDFVENYTGVIACDAFSPETHCRFTLRRSAPSRGIGELYDIDDRAGDDPVRRAELRRSESRTFLTSSTHGSATRQRSPRCRSARPPPTRSATGIA
jgi:hypothetical protein